MCTLTLQYPFFQMLILIILWDFLSRAYTKAVDPTGYSDEQWINAAIHIGVRSIP